MLRKSSLFTQTEFLGLVQALEAFGRIHFATPLIPKSDFRAGLSQLKKAVFETWGESEIAKRCGEALTHANEASFADKIRQTYDLLDSRFSGKLLGERQPFIQKVVQTRNYFTHLGINRSSAVVDEGKGLFLLNQQLHAFLRCVMLLELGVQESELEEPVMHQATRWS
jgi:hypothetical protein